MTQPQRDRLWLSILSTLLVAVIVGSGGMLLSHDRQITTLTTNQSAQITREEYTVLREEIRGLQVSLNQLKETIIDLRRQP